MTKLKIGVACGGTGGHIFPGMATAEVLRNRGHEVTLWLAGKDIEAQATADWDGPSHTVRSDGFQYGASPRTVLAGFKLARAFRQCHRLMARDRPQALLAMGSYASAGPMYAAVRNQVPVVLHEANVLPGRAIRFFSRRATAVAACFEETRHYLPKVDLDITGMPLRAGLHAAAVAHRDRPRGAGPFTILLMGGSRGAAAINEIGSRGVVRLWKKRQDFQVIHLTGTADEAYVRRHYQEAGIPAEVHPYLHDMSDVYSRSDIALCRSGAATLAELCAFAVPSLLIPYPHATHDHQTVNAKALSRMRAADMINEADLEDGWLTEYIEGCINAPDRQEQMRQAMRSLYGVRPAEALADVIERVARPVEA